MTKELKTFIDAVAREHPLIKQGMTQFFINKALSENKTLLSLIDDQTKLEGITQWLASDHDLVLIPWDEIVTKIVSQFGKNNISIDTCAYAYMQSISERSILDLSALLEPFLEKIVELTKNESVEDDEEIAKPSSVSYIHMNEHAAAMDIQFPFFREKAKNLIHTMYESQRVIPHVVSESKWLRKTIIHELANACNELDCPIESFPLEIFLVDGKEIFAAANNQNDVHSVMSDLFFHLDRNKSESKVLVLDNAGFLMNLAGGTIFVKLLGFARSVGFGVITMDSEEFPEETEEYSVNLDLDDIDDAGLVEIIEQMSLFFLDYHRVDARPQLDFLLDLAEKKVPEPKLCNTIQLLEFSCIKERNDKSNMKNLGMQMPSPEGAEAFADLYRERQDSLQSKIFRLSQKTINHSLKFLFNNDHESSSKQINVYELEEKMNIDIFGQKTAIKMIAQSILRAKADLKERVGPLGVFMCLGASGIGKTLTAKTLQKYLYGNDKIVRINMGEFAEATAVSRIFGANAGYVGYDEGSAFLKEVKKNPESVVLVDEIEKAHPQVINSFLNIFDEGYATNAKGDRIDFSKTVIIVTGNVGSRELQADRPKEMGFVQHFDAKSFQAGKVEAARKALKDKFPPEFLNRMHEIIFYDPLEKETIIKIIDFKLREIKEHIKDRGFQLMFKNDVLEELLKKCDDPIHNGARMVDKVIRTEIETPLSMIILKNRNSKVEILPDFSFKVSPLESNIRGHETKKSNKGKSIRTKDVGRTQV